MVAITQPARQLEPVSSPAPRFAVVEDHWFCSADGLWVTPARGGGRTSIATGPLTAIAGLRDQLWAIGPADSGQVLYRIDCNREVRTDPLPGLVGPITHLVPCRLGRPVVIARGARTFAIEAGSETPTVLPVAAPGDDCAIPFRSGDGLGWVIRSGSRLLAHAGGRSVPLAIPDPLVEAGTVCSGAAIEGGRIALELRGASHHIVLADLRRRRRALALRLVDVRCVAWVEDRGHAVVLRRDRELVMLDLRAGVCLATRIIDVPIDRIAVDPTGTHLVLVPAGERDRPLYVDYAELVGIRRRSTASVRETESAVASATATAMAIESEIATATAMAIESETATATAMAIDSETAIASATAATVATSTLDPEILGLPLLALGEPAARYRLEESERDAYLQDLFGWMASLCRRAVADAWDSGRLGSPTSELPYAGEVAAVLDRQGGRAASELQAARSAEHAALDRFGRWSRSGAPHLELSRELELSPLATAALLVVAAPAIWGELARIYGIIANDPGRALIDELLVAQILGLDHSGRIDLARELDDDATLIRHGVVAREGDDRPFAALRVPDVVIRRLTGAPSRTPAASQARAADRSLDELLIPAVELGDLLRALSVDRGRPLRLVLRGRTGSGRRTLGAALAARVGRRLAAIEIAPLGGESPEKLLAAAMQEAALAGYIPCVSGWEPSDDPGLARSITAALDAHPGPLLLRGAPGTNPPIAPGYLTFDIPRLDEATRRIAWEQALAGRELPASAAAALARRYDLGAGVIAQVAAAVDPADPRLPAGGAEPLLEAAIRQHRADRIAKLATRVEHLPDWSDLILDDDQLASLRELCGRISLRHTVLDAWGMEHVASTARGITALFQGVPGTGKTLAAGVIARALGYELYRIDLSRIMSRWLGETEKNLAAVFDAAEDGEMVLLFDEADSLFGKRTEVKSSNDRYANLEVNYLLQRLDSFEGIAVLTTNFGTAVDPAFKRRLSLHLQFPRPDADLRRRLWRAHIPATVPTAGDLGLAELAERYELSGGYIRNAALRAAYLAAAADSALTAAHLCRAVELEYRDKGKLSAEGVLE